MQDVLTIVKSRYGYDLYSTGHSYAHLSQHQQQISIFIVRYGSRGCHRVENMKLLGKMGMKIQKVQQNWENLISSKCVKGKFGKFADITGPGEP